MPLRRTTPLIKQIPLSNAHPKIRLVATTPQVQRRTRLRVEGHSEVADLKREIQSLVRSIVMLRDGGCILRDVRYCGGERGQAVMQADHLISRSNSATYADSRLVVCVCRPCHAWKSLGNNLRKAQYDALVKTLLSPDRVKLWEACEQDSWRPARTSAYDWKVAIVALKAELRTLMEKRCEP